MGGGPPGLSGQSIPMMVDMDSPHVVQEKATSGPEAPPTKIRSLFPETWLWDIVSVKWVAYRIYPAIRRGFCPSRMTSNN